MKISRRQASVSPTSERSAERAARHCSECSYKKRFKITPCKKHSGGGCRSGVFTWRLSVIRFNTHVRCRYYAYALSDGGRSAVDQLKPHSPMLSSFPVPELDDAVIKLSSLKIMTVPSGAVKTFSDLNYLSKSNV